MRNYSIEELIAHRPPMVLLSRMASYDDVQAVCEVDISKESPFFQEALNGVATYIGIEYMAQTIAAFAGVKALQRGEQVDIGFLLGSRKYQSYEPSFTSNKTYQVVVKELYREDSGLSMFECKICDGKRIVSDAKVTTFQPQNPKEFLKEQK